MIVKDEELLLIDQKIFDLPNVAQFIPPLEGSGCVHISK